MKKSYWFMICGLIFSIQACIFARSGNLLILYLLGMAGWMAYKGIRESQREIRRARWIIRRARWLRRIKAEGWM